MRPPDLLLFLVGLGVCLGFFLHREHRISVDTKKARAAERIAEATSSGSGKGGLPEKPTAPGATAVDPSVTGAGAGNPLPESDAELLMGQVEYLEDQLRLTREENARLRKLVEQLGRKPEGGAEATDVASLAARVSSLRKLDFKEPPVAVVQSDDRHREQVSARLSAGLPADYFARLGRAYAVLGFTSLDENLLPAVTECVLEASGGIVGKEGPEVRFFDGDDPGSTGTTALRASELAEMLRRDAFGGRWPWQPRPGEEDRQLARLAVARGDVALIRFQVELADSAAGGEGRAEGFEPGREYYAAPAFLREQLIKFPRVHGGKFALDVHQARGWEGLDAAHRDPPAHTALILHPKLYLEGGFEADIPGWSPPENLGRPIYGGVLGELDLLLFLKRYLPEAMALQAADGWRGDRCAVYGDSLATGEFVWELRFASKGDAAEAFKALRKSMSLRRNWALPEEDGEDPAAFKGSNEERVGIVRVSADGLGVLVAEARDEDRLGEAQIAVGW